jgi:hypothetical protein
MPPGDIKIVADYQAKQGYPTFSASLRRIVREWAESRQGCTCPNADVISQFEDA